MEDYSSRVPSSTKSLTLRGVAAEGLSVVMCVGKLGKLQIHLHIEIGDMDQKILNVLCLQHRLPSAELKVMVM